MSVNLAAKTIKLETEQKALPLERISDKSAMLIDTLSRLCRERMSGSLSEEEYQSRFNQVMQPIVNSAAVHLPVFKDDVCMTAYCSNDKFLEFLGAHDGDVVRIKSEFDFSQASEIPFMDQCVGPDAYDKEGNYPPRLNPYGAEMQIPQWALDETPPDESPCTYAYIMIRSKSEPEPVWSSGGTGSLTFKIDGFFRIRRQITGSMRYFYLDEVPATASDFAE